MNNNKIALIAGGNSGVGKRTAIDLAKQNIQIFIVARNAVKGEQAVKEIQKESNNTDVHFIAADLSSKSNINDFILQLAKVIDHLDILVSSLGIMLPSQQLTQDGYDQNFVLNYLSHFWLINALIPYLQKAAQGRILLIGALPMLIKRLTITFPQPITKSDNYSSMAVTSEALLGRILLTQKLSQTLIGTNITINIFHPGNVPDSNYGSEETSWLLKMIGPLLAQFSKKNQPIGAQLATDPNLNTVTGKFFNESGKIIPLSNKFSAELADEWWQQSLTF